MKRGKGVGMTQLVHSAEGSRDCLIACLAMLSGAAPDEIRTYGIQNSVPQYGEPFDSKVAAIKKYVPWFDGPFRFFFGNGLRKPDPEAPLLIPRRGRGVVACYNPAKHPVVDGILADCHLCVYDDGFLFDCEHPKPIPLNQLTLCSGGAIALVIPEA